jgi:hypothetical protein
MGDYILMKTFILIFITTIIYANNDLSWVNEQIDAIKPPRHGLTRSYLLKTKDPFIVLEKVKKPEEKKKAVYTKTKKAKQTVHKSSVAKTQKKTKQKNINFVLTMVLNKSFMINNKWYREGEKIYGYKLKKLSRNSVLLENKNKKIVLTTRTKNTKLKFN